MIVPSVGTGRSTPIAPRARHPLQSKHPTTTHFRRIRQPPFPNGGRGRRCELERLLPAPRRVWRRRRRGERDLGEGDRDGGRLLDDGGGNGARRGGRESATVGEGVFCRW